MVLAKATHKPTLEIVANPRTEKNITPKQEEFARLYVCEDISQTEAAARRATRGPAALTAGT